MGLLETIKSALGLGSSRDREPEPGSERAVKEPVATDTDASGSTASVTEQPPETPTGNDVAEAAEPAEAAGPVSQVDEPEADEQTLGESDAAATRDVEPSGGEDPAEPADTPDDSEHVEAISGIGPAYANRLGDAGVESVADLAGADASALAEETGISAKRLGRWIEAAEEY